MRCFLAIEQMATVTFCHIATRDVREAHTSRADIVVVAVGQPNLIGADHIREGAIVIDVGINRVTLSDGTKKTVGDVDSAAVQVVAPPISPRSPAASGSIIAAMLLRNTLRSAEILFESNQ